MPPDKNSRSKARFLADFRPNPKVLWRKVGKEIVLLNLDHGRYYGIEGTGVRIWQLLQEKTAPRALLSKLHEEFDVEPEKLREDANRFLAHLEGEGLVVPA